MLPVDFTEHMRTLFGSESDELFTALEGERTYALRANTLKISPDGLRQLLSYLDEPVPWCDEGFYYNVEAPDKDRKSLSDSASDANERSIRPAKSPYYHAGLFYPQEPSAMLPAAIAGIKPGLRVLDMCASPGGKTTQAAAYMARSGHLVSNDINASRIPALIKNCERLGLTNVTVLNENPQRLTQVFPNYFDIVLLDAPCSGEGMFRKDISSTAEWQKHKPAYCASIQRPLLRQAAMMTKPGGQIIYSTCTFETCENEDIIEDFLTGERDFSLMPLDYKSLGISEGFIKNTGRVLPHRQRGEGHFVCALRKDHKASPSQGLDVDAQYRTGAPSAWSKQGLGKRIPFREGQSPSDAQIKGVDFFYDFCNNNLHNRYEWRLLSYGNALYHVPPDLPNLRGVRVSRPGWHLGFIKDKRFEPSHAFAMGLLTSDAIRSLRLNVSDRLLSCFLKGESFEVDCDDGWVLVCVKAVCASAKVCADSNACAGAYDDVCVNADGNAYPLGWGKVKNGRLKNKLPPGLTVNR
ncbi:MAG: RsmB/NOP family class I SAM-dependent RNA methyltransferase [Clostridiales bacterium]|nr:RsmB/NOP family class I SAM-dependent RNA methyltransferase [Clostridiales bacterium]